MARAAVRGLALIVVISGCGSSDSPTEPESSVVFTPDRPSTAATFSLRQGSGTRGGHLQLELFANQVTDVHSVSFVLSIPSQLRFTAQGQGPFLTPNQSTAVLVVTPLPAPFVGVLVVDTRANGAPGISGSGVVLTLEFEGQADGTGRLELTNAEARNSQNQPIPGLQWIGGSARVML